MGFRKPGERGKQGDHGQDGIDGEPGRAGREGHQGRPGDRGLQGIPGKGLQANDRRMLVLYALLVAALVGMGTALSVVQQHSDSTDRVFRQQIRVFQQQIVANCEATNAGNSKVNAVIDQLAKQAASNPARTPEERQTAAATYASLHLPISVCPPGK